MTYSKYIMEGGVGDNIHAIILVTIFTIHFCEFNCLQIFNQNILPQEDDDLKRTTTITLLCYTRWTMRANSCKV